MLSEGQEYRVILGDCIEEMAKMGSAVFDVAIFSPPFPSLYSFTSEAGDIGNSEDLNSDAKLHLSFFYRQLARVVKPGRVVCVHVMQIPVLKRANAEGGLFDFRGLNIRLAQRAGLKYEFDWLIRKNPQAQAIRNKAWELKFQGIETDRAMSRGTLSDYIIKFRTKGDNTVPIRSQGDVSRNDWISWAESCWDDIRETDTLNVRVGRGEGDVKHITPLQLGVIERLVRLYSNPGEVVFSPFAGIGSEGYQALKLGRRFFGVELKPEYQAAAIKNLETAIREREADRRTLFA